MREQARNEASKDLTIPEPKAAEEQPVRERYVDGAIPPVRAGFADQGHSASQLAFEEDENVKELKSKVGALVQGRFGGDYKKAFDHYDGDKDGGVTKSEITKLLSDAGVGNGFTRGIWAGKIIEKLDKSGDAAISWGEFQSVFTAVG